jgi:hypothetical protein
MEMTPIVLIALVAIYFFPTICAGLRGKANGTGGVFLVNLLLGWTLIGWLVSFIWACSGTTEADERREEERHAELLAAMRPAAPAAGTGGAQPTFASVDDFCAQANAVKNKNEKAQPQPVHRPQRTDHHWARRTGWASTSEKQP